MGIARTRTALLKTSAATDVKISGGVIDITGLDPISKKSIVSMNQFKYHAEVAKVETIGTTTPTPQSSTTYIVQITDPTSSRESHSNSVVPRNYVYKTPADLTTLGATAALQREAIYVALIAKINADTANNVTAATSGGGAGFTITDNAGYYPAKTAGGQNPRQGKSSIFLAKDANGNGFVDATHRVLTTDATYQFGEGTRMVGDIAVVYALGGSNIVAGTIDCPMTNDNPPVGPVGGQQYDAFSIQHLVRSEIPTISGGTVGYRLADSMIFVDNGLGSATTNAAGFIAFERDMLRILFGVYKDDSNALIDFFDGGLVASATYPTTGALISTTDNVVMSVTTPNGNELYVNPIGTHTLLTPISGAAGLQLFLDTTEGEGIEITPPNFVSNPKHFVVGEQEFSIYGRIKATDWTHLDDLAIGFREQTNNAGTQAYAATLAAYDAADNNFAVIGLAEAVVSGLLRILTSLEAGGVVSTSTVVSPVASSTHDFIVSVDINGLVSFFIDGVNKTALQATQYKFDAGDIVVPFVFSILDNSDAVPVLVQWAAVANGNWRIN